MTTNFPDKLDPAITRAGRVDLRETFGPINRKDALRMCDRFCADDATRARVIYGGEWPRAAATVQQALIEAQTTGEDAPDRMPVGITAGHEP